MAKSINEWYDTIENEKQSMTQLRELQPLVDSHQTLLSDLNSKSKVSEHRLMIWIMAVLAWMLDTLFDKHKAEIENLISINQFGTLPWYKEQALKFQYGDSLIWINGGYNYSTVKATAQIIKYASAGSTFQSVVIKVAKQINGAPSPLEVIEYNAFKHYYERVQPPGENVVIVSIPADKLNIGLRIYYNPLLITSAGELIESGEKPVETAFKGYLNSFEFNGRFDVNEALDALQNARGVVKPYILSCEAKIDGSSTWQPITEYYDSAAGYMSINNITVEYIAYV